MLALSRMRTTTTTAAMTTGQRTGKERIIEQRRYRPDRQRYINALTKALAATVFRRPTTHTVASPPTTCGARCSLPCPRPALSEARHARDIESLSDSVRFLSCYISYADGYARYIDNTEIHPLFRHLFAYYTGIDVRV